MTIAFEYQVRLPAGQNRRGWASAWHALGKIPFGAGYNAELGALVARAMEGATLRRVVTNEVALGEPLGLPWELRQFRPVVAAAGSDRPASGSTLEQVAVAHTPRLALNHSDELARWIDGNRRAIADGDNLLGPTMLAGAAAIPSADFAWRAPADPAAVVAFNRNTCNGCHGGRAAPGDLPFQHLAAAEGSYYGGGSPGQARLSRHLHTPGSDDELSRRAALLEATLCAPCGAPGNGYVPRVAGHR